MKKDEIPYLRCYKMTYDTGFAPNPYHGVLTLATCKPDIRLHANKGDWIAGFTAKEVHDSNGKIHRFNGDRKLIYLACIKDKLKLEEYWESEDYKDKHPHLIGKNGKIIKENCSGETTECKNFDSGDNIYKMVNGKLQQQENGGGHGENEYKSDTRGEFVLICEEFYYFGVENAINVNDVFQYANSLPRNYKNFSENEGQGLVNFIKKEYPQRGIIEKHNP
jgi:hypothetical protein